MSAGYQPSFGGHLLSSMEDITYNPSESGAEFRKYLQAPSSLQDIRSSYGDLSKHLAGYGGVDFSGINPRYTGLFAPDAQNYRSNLLSASQAALGMSPGFSQDLRRGLGNIYDIMETQYGPSAGGQFSDWVGSAFA